MQTALDELAAQRRFPILGDPWRYGKAQCRNGLVTPAKSVRTLRKARMMVGLRPDKYLRMAPPFGAKGSPIPSESRCRRSGALIGRL